MTIYKYIAENKPNEAYEVCKSYNFYDIQNQDELESCLEMIVAQNGEPAFEKIIELHPDKDVIIEMYKRANPEKPCDCKRNADGAAAAATSTDQKDKGGLNLSSQTNTYILVGALIVALAVISLKK